MKVSVIIPTFNEQNVIGDCLRSLGKQSYKGLEIIVVDDGSTDKTLGVVRKIKNQSAGQRMKIKIYEQEHKGPGPARNLGAEKATGDILVFVDSDMAFESSFIEKLVGPIVEGKTKGTFPLDEKVANWSSWWARMWNLEMVGTDNERRLPLGYGKKAPVFRAILKKEFDKVGGFEPVGYNDDWTLAEKLGYLADGVSGAVVYHKNPETLKDVWRQAKWVGRRRYKLGSLGKWFALLRASFPISLIVGLYKSLKFKKPDFIAFKLLYDLAIFYSLISYIFSDSNAR